MKKVFLLIGFCLLGFIGFTQKSKPTSDTTKAKINKIVKDLKTPQTYEMYVKNENGTIDTVMMFRDPIVNRKKPRY
jgi:hypothetical protein